MDCRRSSGSSDSSLKVGIGQAERGGMAFTWTGLLLMPKPSMDEDGLWHHAEVVAESRCVRSWSLSRPQWSVAEMAAHDPGCSLIPGQWSSSP